MSRINNERGFENLEDLKEYYKDIFPKEVEDLLNILIDREINKQKNEINHLKNTLSKTTKVNYRDIFLLVRLKTLPTSY